MRSETVAGPGAYAARRRREERWVREVGGTSERRIDTTRLGDGREAAGPGKEPAMPADRRPTAP